MIPFFEWTVISFGPVPVRVWGLMVALGILAGLVVAVREARRRGLSAEREMDLAFWIILGSMVGARIFFIITEIDYYLSAPTKIFAVWEGGMSITGGFLGSAAAALLYTWRKQLSFLDYADATVFGLPVGLWIGRLGCFFIFDHPGSPTGFFLGQTYRDGVVRHNHGLYDSLNGLVLTGLFFYLRWRNPHRRSGFYLIVFMIWYGTFRFIADFFRATDLAEADARLGGLTYAQYVMLGLVVGGLALWYSVYRKDQTDKHATTKKTSAS